MSRSTSLSVCKWIFTRFSAITGQCTESMEMNETLWNRAAPSAHCSTTGYFLLSSFRWHARFIHLTGSNNIQPPTSPNNIGRRLQWPLWWINTTGDGGWAPDFSEWKLLAHFSINKRPRDEYRSADLVRAGPAPTQGGGFHQWKWAWPASACVANLHSEPVSKMADTLTYWSDLFLFYLTICSALPPMQSINGGPPWAWLRSKRQRLTLCGPVHNAGLFTERKGNQSPKMMIRTCRPFIQYQKPGQRGP